MYVESPYGLTVTTAPTVEPITLAEAKQHLRIDYSDHDAMITRLIQVAREYVENRTGRQLVTATLTLNLDRFPRVCDDGLILKASEIWLPKSPAQSITSIKYLNESGTQLTLSSSVYGLRADVHPGRIYLKYGQSWPATRNIVSAVEVIYKAGYGLAASVPAQVKQTMLLLTAHLYGNGEPSISGTISSDIPYTLESLVGGLGDGYF